MLFFKGRNTLQYFTERAMSTYLYGNLVTRYCGTQNILSYTKVMACISSHPPTHTSEKTHVPLSHVNS